MKTIILIMITSMLSSVAFAQTVPTKKMAFMGKKTATWCTPCGTWAWTVFSDIYSRTSGEPFIATEMHISSSSVLASSDAATIYTHMEARSSTPVFYVNNINETQYSSSGGIYTNATKYRIYAVADSIGQTDADINAAYTATISPSGVISVSTKTKAFSDVTGDYYLGIYLVETDVVAYQSGIGNTAVHKSILREAISTNAMGDLVSSGAITAGAEFTNTFTHTVDPSYNANNLQLFAVLWKKVGNDYSYESAYSDFQTLVSTPINKIELSNDLAVSAYTTKGELHYQLDNIESNQNVSVDLIGLNGQIEKSIYNGNAMDQVQVTLNVADLPKGVHFIRTIVEGKMRTINIML
jgi:hypothetical protein